MPEFLRFLVMLATAAAAATSDMDMGPYLLTHPNPNLTVLLDTQYKSRWILMWLQFTVKNVNTVKLSSINHCIHQLQYDII